MEPLQSLIMQLRREELAQLGELVQPEKALDAPRETEVELTHEVLLSILFTNPSTVIDPAQQNTYSNLKYTIYSTATTVQKDKGLDQFLHQRRR